MKTEIKKTEIIKCECGTEFQWELPDWAEMIDTLRPKICGSCEEKEWNRRYKERAAKEAREREEAIVRTTARLRENTLSSLPILFQETDINHSRFNASAWPKIKDWQPTKEKPWLGLISETGTCKTRMASLLAIEVMGGLAERSVDKQRYYNFVFTTGYEITELASIVQTGSFAEKEKARERLDAICDATLLLIDDLGKGKLNESSASTLHKVIDHRYANKLYTIWTANSTPEQIAAPMSQDMAAPFAGRLNDHSKILRFKAKN